MEQRYFTTKEAAKRLGLAVRTLEGFRCKGGGPRYCKIGKRIVRYRIEDLDAWAEERIQGGLEEVVDE
jgi:predicted DNA-binding transcriptional regulator AlpA